MRRGVATDEAALRAHLRRTLAPFKQPDRISMVADLARTWSGKPALPAPPAPPAPSASPDFLGLARGYRTSVAVAAAQEAGLWDAWDRHAVHGGVSVANLAAELSLSPAALSIFCDVLMSLGLVQEGEGQGRGEDRKLRSLVPAAAWRASVLALESRLQQSWLTPAAVASVLRAGPHERPFLAANDEDFARVYGAAMTNDAQEAFLRSLLRHVRGPRPRVWEIGRGLGLVASLLAERHALRSGRLSPIAPGPAVLGGRVPAAVTCDAPKTWAELVRADAREEGRLASPPQTFDVIAVVNAIHWVDAPSLRPILVALRRRLAPGGTLMIVDTFLPRQGSALAAGPSRGLGASVLLDWLTHGGLFFFDAETVTSDLEAVFGAPIDVRRVPGFESVAICADNKRVTNGSEQHDGDNQGQVEDRVGEGVAARAGSGVAA
jgi:SAM-dependent methyltransferase